jgi:hypothetical protein
MKCEKSDADILADAREYLEKNGWWRGSLRGPNGRQVCGMGAVMFSQGWKEHEHLLVEDAIGRQHTIRRILNKVLTAVGLDPECYEFTSWNDDVAKNKQQVLDAFAKAEKIERAGFDPDAP